MGHANQTLNSCLASAKDAPKKGRHRRILIGGFFECEFETRAACLFCSTSPIWSPLTQCVRGLQHLRSGPAQPRLSEEGGHARQNDKDPRAKKPIRTLSTPAECRPTQRGRGMSTQECCRQTKKLTVHLSHGHYHVANYLFSLYSSVVNPNNSLHQTLNHSHHLDTHHHHLHVDQYVPSSASSVLGST